MYTRYRLTSLIALVVLDVACAKAPASVTTNGECADVFKGQVCTWSRSIGDSIVDIGALVPIASLENAPADAPFVWPPVAVATLSMPAGVQAKTGISHFSMYWEAMGHPPGTYMTPHFDFHMYMVGKDVVAAVDCKDRSMPNPAPAGYALPNIPLPPPMAKLMKADTLIGLCVPGMGMHAVTASAMADTTAFGGTMVVGYYGGKPLFVEPMVSRAKLLERKPFEYAIPAIPGVTGRYPHAFKAEFDSAQKAYRFVFSNFGAAS